MNRKRDRVAVTVCPAPAGEELSEDFSVTVEGKDVPVYAAKVAPRERRGRDKAMDDKVNSARYFEKAAFATFDMQGRARVTVTCPQDIDTARILPTSFGIEPRVRGKSLSFTIDRPAHLTIEVDGNWVNSLHVFANPPEKDVPSPDDPNVIYFGPGIHEITRMVVDDDKTVYVAGGAVVRAVIGPDEKGDPNPNTGLKRYPPTLELNGKNITLRGRGIIDASRCPTHARNPVCVVGSDIQLEGVIIRDSSLWTVPVRGSDRVSIRNIKLLGYRANSDGIDICNSRDIAVEDCFLRTLDDLVVVKSDKGEGAVERISVKRCVLWNEVAHALSVGAELRDRVDNVVFEDCDVIHDQGREWTLRVLHSDSALVTNIRFENIRIEESRKFVSLWIGRCMWSRDPERGRIRDVVFRNIAVDSGRAQVALTGFDEDHAVEDTVFDKVTVRGEPLARDQVESNAFVRNVRLLP